MWIPQNSIIDGLHFSKAGLRVDSGLFHDENRANGKMEVDQGGSKTLSSCAVERMAVDDLGLVLSCDLRVCGQ